MLNKISEMHPAEQLCVLMKRVVDMGMGTVTGGNVSLMDDDGVIWMSPRGITKSALKPEMIAKYLPDNTLDSENRGSLEAKINIAIHRERPDLKGVVHGHTPAMLAYMLMHKTPELNIIAGVAAKVVKATYTPFRMPGSDELRDVVIEEFKNGSDVVYLENHGIFVGGKDLFDAYAKMEAIELACQINMNAYSMPDTNISFLSDADLESYAEKQSKVCWERFMPLNYSAKEMELRKKLCFMAQTAYTDHLVTVYTGSLSLRLSENEFVITPANCDYLNLSHADLILVKDGKVEEGKDVPENTDVHLEIYKKHPELSAIMISTPLYGMGFAVTDSVFNSYADFEIFMSVHYPTKLGFGATNEQIADALNVDTPTVVVANDFVVTVADNKHDHIRALSIGECFNFMAKATAQVYANNNVLYAPECIDALDETYREYMGV